MARDHEHSLTEAEDLRPEESTPTSNGQAGRAQRMLLTTGIALLLAAATLILVPTVLPQYGWIVRSLAARGVSSLPLYAGGVLLCGFWLSARTTRANFLATQETALASVPLIDKLVQEVAHLGDGLQGMRIEFVYLKDALQSHLERAQMNVPSDTPADGMYRLAASLDQVGLRIEERLNANHLEIGQSLQAVSSTIESLRALDSNARIQREGGNDARIDDSLRGTDHEPIPSDTGHTPGTEGWDHDGAERRSRLGLLDMLDDLGRLLPRKTPPARERLSLQFDPFEDVQDEGWKHSASIPGPLPSDHSDHTGDELRFPGAGELLGSGFPNSPDSSHDETLGEKLAELQSLLADDLVREALVSIDRNRR